MDPIPLSRQQRAAATAAAAVAASAHRAQTLTAEELAILRDRVGSSVLLQPWAAIGAADVITFATIIASSPTFSYILLHKRTINTCELVFPPDGARVNVDINDFMIIDPDLAVAKINIGSMIPVRFAERPVSFMDNVYLYVEAGRGLTPGFVVNPTGDSKLSYFPGNFLIDNAPDLVSDLGAPVFDEAGDFLGIVISRENTCLAMGASMIKEVLRQRLPTEALEELTRLKVL